MENNADVRSVKQFDWVKLFVPPVFFMGQLEIHFEPLQVYDQEKHGHRGQQVQKIRARCPVESLV